MRGAGLAWLLGLSWHAAVANDVSQYFRSLPPTIAQCVATGPLRTNELSVCIYVTPDGAIIQSDDFKERSGSGKQMIMDLMLREVLRAVDAMRGAHKGWLSFAMVYGADGPRSRRPYPVLGFGKIHPAVQPGLLIPNPFFVNPRWWETFTDGLYVHAQTRPWHTKSAKGLFRGACGPGAKARFELLSVRDTEHLDVGFTKADGYDTVQDCVFALAKEHRFKRADAVYLLNNKVLPQVPQNNYSHYRYLIHMPGSATGSYSRNLQYLWSHGSIVLIYRHEAIEYYYQWLREGETHLAVDDTDILEKIRWVEANITLRKTLLKGARTFQRKYLSNAALVDRWWSILGPLRERQDTRPPVPPPTACTCDAGLLARRSYPECTKCEITRLKDHRLAKFVGVVPKPPAGRAAVS